MRVGRHKKYVTLARMPVTSGDADGFYEDLSPRGDWAAIEPLQPVADGRTLQHLVTMRYRSDVTIDTRVLYGSRELFVKAVQNVQEQNVELRLLCEEIVP